jgi:hypothetical protein
MGRWRKLSQKPALDKAHAVPARILPLADLPSSPVADFAPRIFWP